MAAPTSAAGFEPAPDPDAELVAICHQHVANRNACNAVDIPDGHPLWDAYNRTADVISAAKPMTLKGLAAKAMATKAEATSLDGTEELEAMSADWAWDLVNDLIRIGNTG